jgi:hypothetical protein
LLQGLQNRLSIGRVYGTSPRAVTARSITALIQFFNRCAKVFWGQMRIDHGGLNATVAQEVLRRHRIHTRHDGPTRKGVSEIVEAKPGKAQSTDGHREPILKASPAKDKGFERSSQWREQFHQVCVIGIVRR